MVRTTYVFDRATQTMVEKSQFHAATSQVNAPAVMGDISGYQSMATGEWIGSRSAHREHLKRNHLIEIGNERMENKPRPVDRVGIRKAAEDAVRRVLG